MDEQRINKLDHPKRSGLSCIHVRYPLTAWGFLANRLSTSTWIRRLLRDLDGTDDDGRTDDDDDGTDNGRDGQRTDDDDGTEDGTYGRMDGGRRR